MDQQPREQLPAVTPVGNEAMRNAPMAAPENTLRSVNETVQSRAIEQAAPNTASVPAVPMPVDPTMVAVQAMQTVAATQPSATPQIADDTDLIEKEWVIKAKQIVQQTKDNPYQQNKDMSRYKAEYLKKRFNKEIRLGEE